MTINSDQNAEIEAQRSVTRSTRRAVSEGIEEILYQVIPVLDHGFIRVIDYMGDDSAVVQSARVSYGRGTKQVSEDRGLIRYLMRHRHTTPFEMCEIKYHCKLPIFVARQWIRHRTANINEYSARYSILDNEFYIPDAAHLASQSDSNRQGRSEVLDGDEANRVLHLLRDDAENAYKHYAEMLNETSQEQALNPQRRGLARELARMNLSLNFYTQWYWKIDLHNLMHFLELRADPHAQYEIRAYAEVLLETVRCWVPDTFQAFMDYGIGSVRLSASALETVKRLISGEEVSREDTDLSAREWSELMRILGLNI